MKTQLKVNVFSGDQTVCTVGWHRPTFSWLTDWDSSCLGVQVPVWSVPGLPHPPVSGCGPHSPLSAVPFLPEVVHWLHGDACSKTCRKACSKTPSLRVVLHRRTWKRTRCWWILADCHKSPKTWRELFNFFNTCNTNIPSSRRKLAKIFNNLRIEKETL